MDWTGGTRRRYAGKGKGNATVQKQKAHFAKARAAIGHQVQPETFFHSATASREFQPRMAPTCVQIEHSQVSQPREPSRDGNPSLSTYQERDRVPRKMKRLNQTAQTPAKRNAAVSEEELALMANRKRLLARDDWLGLAASRPVRINFPSNKEQARIGKRRKIDRPKPRKFPHPELHAVHNPFEEINLPFEPVMSGAIGHDSIRIKIGNDALLSQTQRSRGMSHNSANTSIRPLSTDFGPISEESMLLKADSDGFEAEEVSYSDGFGDIESSQRDLQHVPEQLEYTHRPDIHQLDRGEIRSDDSRLDKNELSLAMNVKSYDELANQGIASTGQHLQNQVPNHWYTVGAAQPGLETGLDHGDDAIENHHMQELSSRNRDRRNVIHDARPDDESMSEFRMLAADRNLSLRAIPQNQADPSPALSESPRSASLSRAQREMDSLGTLQRPHIDQVDVPPTSSTPDEEKDERIWKGFMHIRQAVPSNVSVAALRSSSPHLTQSTASVWPAIPGVEAEIDDEMLDDQEDLKCDKVQQDLQEYSPAHIAQRNLALTAISSPSPSHRQNLQVIDHALVPEPVQDEELEQDELWRQFVVGSDSSQDQSSRGGGRRMHVGYSDELLPAPLSSTQPTNDQLRSDRVTTGGSIYAAATIESQHETSSQDRVNTSLAGHATTASPERDTKFEESELASRKRRKTTNIHANEYSEAPKRRLGPRKRTNYAPVPRALPRVVIKGSTLAQPRSIYDLSTSSD